MEPEPPFMPGAGVGSGASDFRSRSRSKKYNDQMKDCYYFRAGASGCDSLFLVDFCPESLLEVLLCALERLVVLEGVQVGQHAHDPGESMHLDNKKQ